VLPWTGILQVHLLLLSLSFHLIPSRLFTRGSTSNCSFLHGLTGGSYEFYIRNLVNRIVDHYRFLVVDSRGCSESPALTPNYSVVTIPKTFDTSCINYAQHCLRMKNLITSKNTYSINWILTGRQYYGELFGKKRMSKRGMYYSAYYWWDIGGKSLGSVHNRPSFEFELDLSQCILWYNGYQFEKLVSSVCESLVRSD
jgi:hypothetical protein